MSLKNGQRIALKSHHGTYLRADTNGTVNQTSTVQDWEIWHVEEKGKKIALKSHHGNYLTVDGSTIKLGSHPQEWKVKKDLWKSEQKTFLLSGGNNTVSAGKDKKDSNIKWTIEHK
eukprot:TRINITY_DN276_c0_g1_i1.p1 TRINITY_DN276_c0_g1~~TRINITY_DN276_c0_g1_i1.p1  ORF type:complete len:116 (-),score=26.62 TRINITY_DN276_c0_g1_i1:66-413(-)